LGSKQLIINTLAFPLALLIMMLVVFGKIAGEMSGGPYIQRLAPGVILFASAASAIGTGVGLFADVRAGLVDRLRSMPIHRTSIFTGRVAGDVCRVLTVTVVTAAVSHLVGFRFSEGLLAALAFFGVAAVFASIFLWLAVVLALFARSEDAIISLLNPILQLMLFFSSGFVPVAAFPAFLRPVVSANPLSIAHSALMGLSSGGPVAVPILRIMVLAGIVNVVLAPLAIRLYNRR
jgi:ABC transporter DrrB family efflux protein